MMHEFSLPGKRRHAPLEVGLVFGFIVRLDGGGSPACAGMTGAVPNPRVAQRMVKLHEILLFQRKPDRQISEHARARNCPASPTNSQMIDQGPWKDEAPFPD